MIPPHFFMSASSIALNDADVPPPGAMPADIVAKINADVNAVLADPAIRERLVAAGMAPGGGTAAAFKAMLDADMKKWGEIIKRLAIQLD